MNAPFDQAEALALAREIGTGAAAERYAMTVRDFANAIGVAVTKKDGGRIGAEKSRGRPRGPSAHTVTSKWRKR